MRGMTGAILGGIFLASGLLPADPLIESLLAGECLEGEEQWVQCLETGKDKDGPCDPQSALYCLSLNLPFATNRWAGPVAAGVLGGRRDSPYKERLARALLPRLDERSDLLRARPMAFQAARVLARYGIGRLGEHDVFAILISAEPPPLVDLAALGDPRTVDFLADRYAELLAQRTSSKPSRDLREQAISLLNCLYHIPGDAAVELARSIMAQEPDAMLVERARLVVARGAAKTKKTP